MIKPSLFFSTVAPLALAAFAAPALVAQNIPEPLSVPAPGPQTAAPYAPQAILPGGIVMPLYPPDSPYLNKERITEPEKYTMTSGTPGRIQSIVNIHNPSIEVHTVGGNRNTGSAVILAAGGGHRTLVVGTESADFWPFFYNYGVSVIILRNRLRSDGYEPTTDAVRDALQAVRLVRKNAAAFGIDPNKIGIMGFSAGAELSSPAAVLYKKFDEENNDPSDPLAGVSSRPDWAGVIYPGPTPFARGQNPEIPRNAPPSFIATSGSGDQIHAIWAMEYFDVMLKLGVPNIELRQRPSRGRSHRPQRNAIRHLAAALHRLVPRSGLLAAARSGHQGRDRYGSLRQRAAPARTRRPWRSRTGSGPPAGRARQLVQARR